MSRSATRSKIIGLLVISLLVVTFAYSRDIMVAPRWTITVRDTAGRPVTGVRVNEIWAHYTLERMSHEDNRWTNEEGTVTFPARTIRASLGSQALAWLRKTATLNLHMSYGPTASVGIHHKMPNGRDLHVLAAPEGTIANSEVIVDR